jgi:hypothetical protein
MPTKDPKDVPMTQDKKTIHLILWMVFSCVVMGAACYIHGVLLITGHHITEPIQLTTVQGMSDKAAVGLAAGATILISTLARVRTDPQSTTGDTPVPAIDPTIPTPVEVTNTTANPVITEPHDELPQTRSARSAGIVTPIIDTTPPTETTPDPALTTDQTTTEGQNNE